MSPQRHAPVNEKHFEIVGPTLSNTVEESEAVFIFGKLAEVFVYKRSSVSIIEVVCCHFVKAFSMAGKQKSFEKLYAN